MDLVVPRGAGGGGSMLFTELFLQSGWVRIVSRDLLGFLSTETSQLPESSLAKKERGREVLWASTFKYLDILHLQMLVLSRKFVSKMNYNRCSLLTRFLTLANTAGHHFLNPCFLISERLYTVASDFLSIERIKTSFIVSFLYCLSPHYVRSKWYKILFTIK